LKRLEPAADATPADWIVAGVHGFGESVLSLVPAGFPAYVRLFHPAYRHATDGLALVCWRTIAEANGTQAHAGMQLSSLTGIDPRDPQPGVFDHPPKSGSLPPEVGLPLAETLATSTSTPEQWWFAFWEGWGGLSHDILSAPTFDLPHRRYHLMVGPETFDPESAVEGFLQSPNLWWPDDRAWCVATEVDLDSTYIGCSEACRDAILRRAELEVFPIEPERGLAYDSDSVNPLPHS
jgi:hypothetical protein